MLSVPVVLERPSVVPLVVPLMVKVLVEVVKFGDLPVAQVAGLVASSSFVDELVAVALVVEVSFPVGSQS